MKYLTNEDLVRLATSQGWTVEYRTKHILLKPPTGRPYPLAQGGMRGQGREYKNTIAALRRLGMEF